MQVGFGACFILIPERLLVRVECVEYLFSQPRRAAHISSRSAPFQHTQFPSPGNGIFPHADSLSLYDLVIINDDSLSLYDLVIINDDNLSLYDLVIINDDTSSLYDLVIINYDNLSLYVLVIINYVRVQAKLRNVR